MSSSGKSGGSSLTGEQKGCVLGETMGAKGCHREMCFAFSKEDCGISLWRIELNFSDGRIVQNGLRLSASFKMKSDSQRVVLMKT